MKRAFFVALTLPIILFSGQPPAAPAPVPKEPILRISLDRRSYLPYEPILVEWTIINGRDETIHYYPRALESFHFECTDAAGHRTIIDTREGCFGSEPVRTLPFPPRSARKYWYNLREWRGLVGVGEFKLRAITKFGYARGPEDIIITLRSPEVAFRVVKPSGADAAAVRLIEGPEPPPPLPRPGRDMKAYRKALMEAINYEELTNRWIFPFGWYSRLDDVLTKTKSARFHAAANYYRGFYLTGEYPKRDYEWESYRKGFRHLRACMASKAASPYLKGLAAYRLLLCAAAEKGPAARKETAKQARALIANYPGTYMAQEARAILDKLSTTGK